MIINIYTLLLLSFSYGATLLVPEEYSTIQLAIDASQEGDSVFVSTGTYSEHIYIEQSLNIFSADGVIIDASNNYGGINISASNVQVNGFEIIGSDNTVYGIICEPGSDNVQIINNIVHGMSMPNSAGSPLSYGILLYEEGGNLDPPESVLIEQNEIYNISG